MASISLSPPYKVEGSIENSRGRKAPSQWTDGRMNIVQESSQVAERPFSYAQLWFITFPTVLSSRK